MHDPSAAWGYADPLERVRPPEWMSNPWFFVPWMAMEFWGHGALNKGVESLAARHVRTGLVGHTLSRAGFDEGLVWKPRHGRKTGMDRLREDVSRAYGRPFNQRDMGRYVRSERAQARALGVNRASHGFFGYSTEIQTRARARYGIAASTTSSIGRTIFGIGRSMGIWFMAELGATAAQAYGDYVRDMRREAKPYGPKTLETGGEYVDTRMAQTQRMRALQAIHNSQLTTRASIGNEAAMTHWQG